MHSLLIRFGRQASPILENGGTLEAAQRIAGHADSRTTKLYDRRGQKVLIEDMERIRY
jgi:site-specific recombinase XerD